MELLAGFASPFCYCPPTYSTFGAQRSSSYLRASLFCCEICGVRYSCFVGMTCPKNRRIQLNARRNRCTCEIYRKLHASFAAEEFLSSSFKNYAGYLAATFKNLRPQGVTFKVSFLPHSLTTSLSNGAHTVDDVHESLPSFSSPMIISNKEGERHSLSAKERRKLRNERREEQRASKEPWKETVENRLLEKPKKIKTWQQEADVNRLKKWGRQWWMLHVTRNFEHTVADHISTEFANIFPDNAFEVLVPTVPSRTRLKDGTISPARKRLFPGIVLLNCCMDRDVFNFVRKIPQAHDFFGNKAGISYMPIIMPAPVSLYNIEEMFGRIHKEEKEMEEFREQIRKELEEQEKVEPVEPPAIVLEVGSTVRVMSGPFAEFTGIVTQMDTESEKLKVQLTIFGKDTEYQLNTQNVVVVSSAKL